MRVGLFGAEPWSLEMKEKIQDRMGILAMEHCGLTELMGPGVSFSCEHGTLHLNEDHVLAEVHDTKTERPLPMEGETFLAELAGKVSTRIKAVVGSKVRSISWRVRRLSAVPAGPRGSWMNGGMRYRRVQMVGWTGEEFHGTQSVFGKIIALSYDTYIFQISYVY